MELSLTIEGDSLTYKKTLSEFQAGQIISYLNNTESAVGTPERTPTLSIVPGGTYTPPNTMMSSSPRGALNDANATTNPQRIAAFGNYITTSQGKETFSMAEVREMFKKAGEPLPKNFSRDQREAVRMNYITELGKDQFIVTEKGIQCLSEKFADEAAPTPRKKSTAPKRKDASKAIIREEVASLALVPDLDGYPGYWSIATKTQRILWLLTFADAHGVDGLSGSEVSSVANRLKDHIPVNNLNALTKESVKKGYIIQAAGMYKIRKQGLDYVKSLGHAE